MAPLIPELSDFSTILLITFYWFTDEFLDNWGLAVIFI